MVNGFEEDIKKEAMTQNVTRFDYVGASLDYVPCFGSTEECNVEPNGHGVDRWQNGFTPQYF